MSFVFERDVRAACTDPSSRECESVVRAFVRQECWAKEVALGECHVNSRFPLCLEERTAHFECLGSARARADAVLRQGKT